MTSENSHVTTSPEKENKHTLGWIFGVLFLLGGLGMFTTSFLTALTNIVVGLLLLPPSRKWVEQKINRTLSRPILIVISIILFSIGGAAMLDKGNTESTSVNNNSVTTSNTNQIKVTPTVTAVVKDEPKLEPIFDLETLYNKKIDEIRNILGKPTDGDQTDPTDLQMQVGVTEWNNTFEKDNYELLVTYNPTNGSVIDFFLGTTDPSGATKNVDDLKYLLNVNDSRHYTVEPIPTIKDKSSYTGIKAVPVK